MLIDEIPFMLRCGFNSFEVANAPTLKALEAGRLPGPPIHYQPGSGGDEAPAGVAAVAAGLGRRSGMSAFPGSRKARVARMRSRGRRGKLGVPVSAAASLRRKAT